MAVNLFYGWTAAELLTELRKAQEDYASGAMLMSSGAGEVNASRMIQINAEQRIRQIQKALYTLDPDTYSEFQHAMIRQTVARFDPHL